MYKRTNTCKALAIHHTLYTHNQNTHIHIKHTNIQNTYTHTIHSKHTHIHTHYSDWVPRLALKPQHWSTARRWQHVLGALTSESVLKTLQQLGTIGVVVTLRTLLQVRWVGGWVWVGG